MFTKGQVGQTSQGPLFMGRDGQHGGRSKFVAGVTVDTEIRPGFICGALVGMGEEVRFMTGQMLGGCSSSPARWAKS